jgi:hypothetical protein
MSAAVELSQMLTEPEPEGLGGKEAAAKASNAT